MFIKCGEICTTYKNTAGAGHTVRPDEAIFFINYGKALKTSLEKGKIKMISVVMISLINQLNEKMDLSFTKRFPILYQNLTSKQRTV